MPRIKPIDNQQDAGIAETLDQVKKKLGIVPNLFATLAHAPAALHSYLQFNDTLAQGSLSAKQREIVALAVAQNNQCQYCLSAHSVMGKGAGLSEADIAKARKGTADNAIDNAIATFAQKVVAERGVISEAEFAAFSRNGLTPALMVEIVANVTINIFTNYINHLADTEIDFPVVDVVQGAA